MNSSTLNENLVIDRKNKRLVIRKYSLNADLKDLTPEWLAIAHAEGLEKVWIWAYHKDLNRLKSLGFTQEGEFSTNQLKTPSLSLAYYLSGNRGHQTFMKEEDQIIKEIQRKPITPLSPLPPSINIKTLTIESAAEISKLLAIVFKSYPTPVNDPNYISKLIQSGCVFAGAFSENVLISVASSYPEADFKRYEMTDCATFPKFRGYNLTERILGFLESVIQESYTPYSLARARSYGMNRVFYKLGYTYKGRLVNNCDIAGGFEDMNLWVKSKK